MAGCLRFIHYCMNLFTSSTKSKCLVKDQAHMTRSLIAQISMHLHVPRLKSITIILSSIEVYFAELKFHELVKNKV